MLDKASLRRQLAEKRRALSREEWRSRSERVQQALLSDALFAKAETIALYRPMGNEVETELLHEAALARKKKIGYPELSHREGVMRFVSAGPACEWCTGPLGFEVPVGATAIPLEAIELFVLPGLGFDRAGRRLGRGAGHYDRTLAAAPGVRIGLALDFQLLDELPEDPWDVRLDAVFAEVEIIRASERAGR